MTLYPSIPHLPGLLDEFLDDPTWGASSGSRKRWKRDIGTPDLAATIVRVRSAFSKSIRP